MEVKNAARTIPKDYPASLRARWTKVAERAAAGNARAAIRVKCMDCQCWQRKEVNECQLRDCGLWAARERFFRQRKANTDG